LSSEASEEGGLGAVPTDQPGTPLLGEATSLDLEPHVARLERQLIAAALARARGNLSQTARLLGLSRNGLVDKMQRHGLEG
jgi:two-component system, NtrC family, response regulator AtoC